MLPPEDARRTQGPGGPSEHLPGQPDQEGRSLARHVLPAGQRADSGVSHRLLLRGVLQDPGVSQVRRHAEAHKV